MKTLIASLIIFALSISAEAAKLTAVKNGKALVDLEGESAQPGSQFFALDPSGKKRALMEVKQVKGGKAIAVVVKGTAQGGYTLEPYSKGGGSASSSSSRSGAHSDKPSWGLMAGFVNSSMTAKNSSGSVSMTGTSFDLVGYYQTYLDKNISVKGMAGYETLNVSGSGSIQCTDGTYNCNANLGYLGLSALIKYTFYRTASMEFSVGGGLGFLFAMQKSSNILETSKITTNQTVIGSLGVDYRLNKKTYIPVQFDYGFFPDNNTSSATQMILRAGYGWNF